MHGMKLKPGPSWLIASTPATRSLTPGCHCCLSGVFARPFMAREISTPTSTASIWSQTRSSWFFSSHFSLLRSLLQHPRAQPSSYVYSDLASPASPSLVSLWTTHSQTTCAGHPACLQQFRLWCSHCTIITKGIFFSHFNRSFKVTIWK